MRHSTINFTDKNIDFISMRTYSSNNTNRSDIQKMKQILSKAISLELTQRQRQCITMYYYDNMNMRQIAKLLSLSPSTVTRHIRAAKVKLQNIARYY